MQDSRLITILFVGLIILLGVLGYVLNVRITQSPDDMVVSSDITSTTSQIENDVSEDSTDMTESVVLTLVTSTDMGSVVEYTYELSVDGNLQKTFETSRTLALSPNKNFIAFESDDPSFAIQLYAVVHDNMTYEVPLDPTEMFDVGEFVWSSQNVLAFTIANTYRETRLYLFDPGSFDIHEYPITSFVGCDFVCYTQAPAWSPDGYHLALVEYQYDLAGDIPVKFFITIFDTDGNRITSRKISNMAGEFLSIDQWIDDANIGYFLGDEMYDTIVLY